MPPSRWAHSLIWYVMRIGVIEKWCAKSEKWVGMAFNVRIANWELSRLNRKTFSPPASYSSQKKMISNCQSTSILNQQHRSMSESIHLRYRISTSWRSSRATQSHIMTISKIKKMRIFHSHWHRIKSSCTNIKCLTINLNQKAAL